MQLLVSMHETGEVPMFYHSNTLLLSVAIIVNSFCIIISAAELLQMICICEVEYGRFTPQRLYRYAK